MNKEAWALVVFILFLISVYGKRISFFKKSQKSKCPKDSIDRHLTFTEATFVFSTALLYYNYVWVVVSYAGKGTRSQDRDRSLLLLLFSSVFIGTVGYFNDDLW